MIHEMLTVVPRRDDLIVAGDRRLSSDEVIDWAAQAAATLEPGQPTAFQLPTGPEGVVAYRACWQAGAVAVPLLHSDEGRQRSHAFATLGINRLLDPSEHPAGGNATHRQITQSKPEDRALIMFTSGSSGAPKGVVHSQAALAYKTRQTIAIQAFTPQDAGLFPASLAHVAGLLHAVLIPGAASIKTVLMARWEPGEALRLIEHEQITYMVGPPTFFNDLMSHPDFSPSRTASLRLLSIGGSSITPAFVNRARNTFGCVVKRAYGSTEAPTATTCTIHDDPERMANTDGRPFAPTQIRVDEHGEIQVFGPEVTVGYLDSAHTAAAFTEDGWFRTGDLGRIDADGYLTVIGRLGQKIIRGGENIDAIEVEAILESHPSVSQAVALGEPDDRLGERVAAFVVVDGPFDLDECRRWFAEAGAARFMTPEQLIPIAEMPTMPSGKPDRSELSRLLEDSTR